MARCFLTGVELPIEETYVLDIAATYRALKDFREKVAALERLIQQLRPWDDVEIYHAKKRETIIRKDRRLLSHEMAKLLSTACPDRRLFIPWAEWRSRRAKATLTATNDAIASTAVFHDANVSASSELSYEECDVAYT